MYKWSYFVPQDYFDQVNIGWQIFSQWKTWPCGDHDGYDAQICESCGIFNDIHVNQGAGVYIKRKEE